MAVRTYGKVTLDAVAQTEKERLEAEQARLVAEKIKRKKVAALRREFRAQRTQAYQERKAARAAFNERIKAEQAAHAEERREAERIRKAKWKAEKPQRIEAARLRALEIEASQAASRAEYERSRAEYQASVARRVEELKAGAEVKFEDSWIWNAREGRAWLPGESRIADVPKVEINPDFHPKPRSEMTPEELAKYEAETEEFLARLKVEAEERRAESFDWQIGRMSRWASRARLDIAEDKYVAEKLAEEGQEEA